MTPLKKITHMLSFDVEEYFQVEAAAHIVSPDGWPTLEKRLPESVDKILTLLNDRKTSATFFVLGWVAKNEPDVVKRIAEAGHEIASHGMSHRMLTRLSPEEFRSDLQDSRKTLEDLTGRKVIGYRAPTFSITRKTAWALDVLAEAGFEYDSSIFPIRHDRYGVPEAPIFPHLAIGPCGGKILELPPLVRRVLTINLPVGGGGYFRLLPARIVRGGVAFCEKQNRPAMLYLHPWELDPDQPELPLSRLSRFRHRVNLAKTEGKLRLMLSQFHFSDVQSHLLTLPASGLPEFSYKPVI
jgi:polysaccharide deacetylase family protein (PEP-CTERM system associated)